LFGWGLVETNSLKPCGHLVELIEKQEFIDKSFEWLGLEGA